jgi:hypothetical protein
MAFPATHSLPDLQFAFLTILPRIERHGRVYFRHVRCPDVKADAVAEMVALSWRWFVRLAQRGKDATRFPSVLAIFAARAVRGGRRLCGKEKAKDVLSPAAQRRHSFVVTKLPDVSTLFGGPLDEALRDNTRSEVPQQVAFRLDFPAWRLTRTGRDRRVIDDFLLGEGTCAVADRHGLSPARVSQLRREFHADWETFCGELPVGSAASLR